MLKKILLAAAVLSSTYGADEKLFAGTDFTPVVTNQTTQTTSDRNLTAHITSETKVSPNRSTTKHITLSGEINFGEINCIEINFNPLRLNGDLYKVCFKFNRHDKGDQSIITLTANAESDKCQISLGGFTEAVLLFDTNGELDTVKLGKASQFNKNIDLILSTETSKHTIILDLHGLKKSIQTVD